MAVDQDVMRETLIAEYQEAGEQCRSIERLTRTGLQVVLVFAAALLALNFQVDMTRNQSALLAFLGAVAGLFLASTVRGHQLYYRSYMRRLKAIEKDLGMTLYTNGGKAISGWWPINRLSDHFLIVLRKGPA